MTTTQVPGNDATTYMVDAWQRAILTLDVLRERGNQYLEHDRTGNPPVLVFDSETRDRRPQPGAAGQLRAAAHQAARRRPPTDPKKRPFVIVDPRAGHGPGIGGFKMDSEVGIALQVRPPCYFVTFFPRPAARADDRRCRCGRGAFMRKRPRAPSGGEGKPCVIGNCQGGWALMMLAALAPELVGPDPARGLADLLLGRASRARTRCATPAAARRHAGSPRSWATSATASSTAPIW